MDNVKFKKEEYYINSKSNEIWFKGLFANQYVKELSENEVKDIVFNDESVIIFINFERDHLTLIENEEFKSKWENEYMGHIADEDDLRRGYEFKRGCCYHASLWKMKYGRKIILFSYDH